MWVWVHTFRGSIQDAETGNSEIKASLKLHTEFQASWGYSSKKKKIFFF